jgi:rhodanese-related sulfurtransferase
MKKTIALLATVVIAASVFAGEFADVSIKEVKALTESKNKKAVIIDVNGTESYNKGHVPGALNWAAIKDNLETSLPKDKNALIVAYCGNPKCQAYQAAAKAASQLGYKNVKHMSAGIAGWKEAGEKTEKGETKKST